MSMIGSPQTPTRLGMSVIGRPQSPTHLVEAVWRYYEDRTRSQSFDVSEDTSKVNCMWLLSQRWWRAVDPKEVERRRREQIQNPAYYRARIRTRLGMFERHVSTLGLQELLQMTDDLTRLLVDLGATPDDFQIAQEEIPETVTEFWDAEYLFQEGRKQEFERKSYRSTDLPPASSTQPPPLPLAPPSPNRLSPSSNGASKGVGNARVQKKRHQNSRWSGGKRRKARASERRRPSPQASEEEPGTGASVESTSGRGPPTTAMGEKTVPSARASRGRAGTKTKAADQPRRSTRIHKKPSIEEKQKAIIGGHYLRPKSHRVTK